MYAKKKKYEGGGILEKLKQQAAAAKARVSEGVQSVKDNISEAKEARAEVKKEKAESKEFFDAIDRGEYEMIGEYDSMPDLSTRRRQDRMDYQRSQMEMEDMGDGVSVGQKTFTYKDMEGYQPKDYRMTQDSDGKYRVYLKKEYGMGGKMKPVYKAGGKLGKRKALDFNKDGKITKEDFAMLRAMAKKKKGKK